MVVLISKLITKTDTESYLSFPTCSLGLLPFEDGHSMNMNVYDNSGRECIFSSTIQRNDSIGRFLSVGWLDFVRHKDVREKDKITILEDEIIKNQVTGTRIRIEVKRKIRLFGQDIWADV
ncbi:conserved hypothetical protein [Ricinus communis]|uniref:TF-B3 domain-containing protein n=1 Tax=Ricinus communis TaxID=3988 RepID=B9SSP8_RICCO|nr:conserved hypothetical protein [Ricinus communis]